MRINGAYTIFMLITQKWKPSLTRHGIQPVNITSWHTCLVESVASATWTSQPALRGSSFFHLSLDFHPSLTPSQDRVQSKNACSGQLACLPWGWTGQTGRVCRRLVLGYMYCSDISRRSPERATASGGDGGRGRVVQGRTHGGGPRGPGPLGIWKTLYFQGFFRKITRFASLKSVFLSFLLCGRTEEACRMIKSLRKIRLTLYNYMTNIDSNDVRKIAKLVNTQRFDILSFSRANKCVFIFCLPSKKIIYRNVGYSLIFLFFVHHYYQRSVCRTLLATICEKIALPPPLEKILDAPLPVTPNDSQRRGWPSLRSFCDRTAVFSFCLSNNIFVYLAVL